MPGVKAVAKHQTAPLTTGGTQTLQIPAGGKIHSLALHFMTSAGASVTEAQIRAEIANIRFTIGGRNIVNCSPVILLDAYETLGTEVHSNTGIAGVVELNIGRLLFTDPGLRDLFGFGTAGSPPIQISISAGTLSAIASVECYTEREAVNEALGSYCSLINYPQTFNSTGIHTVENLSREPSTKYALIMVDDGASGAIASGEVRMGQVSVRESVPLNVNAQLLSNNRLTQPSGYFVHGFSDGTLAALLSMAGVADFRVLTNFGTAPGAGGYNLAALTVENFTLPGLK